MSGEEVIYHDVSSPRPPPPQQVPSGSAEEEEPPKKKCGFVAKVAIASVAVALIFMLAVGFSPVGRFSNAGKPDSLEGATGPTYPPTYFPTYWPTYAPTYAPTDAEEEALVTTVAATTAAAVTTAPATTEPVTTEAAVSTEAAVATTTEATTTTTTTTSVHPVCGNQTDYKVFKIQFTPSSVNATYSFSSKDTGAVWSSIQPGDLPLDEMTEERVCVPAGEYEYSMTEGACVNGFFRGKLILYSCNEGTISVTVNEAPQLAQLVQDAEGEDVQEPAEGEVVQDEAPQDV